MNFLRSIKVAPVPAPLDDKSPQIEPAGPLLEMRLKKSGIVARAREIDGEFVVLAGSGARTGWSGVNHSYGPLKQELESSGIITVTSDGKTSVFSHDKVFASPSAAAAMVAGRTANGRVDWKIAGSGITYADWQDMKLEEAAKSIGISKGTD